MLRFTPIMTSNEHLPEQPPAATGAAQTALVIPSAWRTSIGQILCVAVPAMIWFAPSGLEPLTQHGLAIAAFMIVAWITQAMDQALAGFIGCFLFWALGVAKFNVAFSGFANDTAWFLFGALLLGAVATKSGIARRLAYLVMLRVGSTYPRVLLGLVVTDFLLTFMVPSGLARVAIMAPIAIGIIEAFGAKPGSNIGRGLFLLITYAAGLFDKMIIAGAASITARGLMERIGQVEVLWSHWFLAYFPCDLITILVAWRLVLWLYPPEHAALDGGFNYPREQLSRMGSWTWMEKKSAILMIAAIALWLTDFLHHIPASMIGLGVGLFALLPRAGVLEADELRRVNYSLVFFAAAAVGMGEVLAATGGLEVLTKLMFAWMEPFMSNVYSSTLTLYVSAFIYHIFLASEVSMLGTSIPALMHFAKSHAMNPLAVGMIWTFAAAGKIFVYQSPVLIVGYSYGYFTARDLLRIGFWLTLAEGAILLVLVPYYWPWIGISY